jgi:hypothetical protein
MHRANGLKAISRCKGVSILGGYVALTYLFVEGSNAGRFRPMKSLLSGRVFRILTKLSKI